MADLKGFRKANKLTQFDVASYLGISKAFICKIEKGKDQLPPKQLEKLLNNPFGWVTEKLTKPSPVIIDSNVVTGDGNAVGNNSVNNAIEPKLIAELQAQRKQIDRLLGIIEKLSN